MARINPVSGGGGGGDDSDDEGSSSSPGSGSSEGDTASSSSSNRARRRRNFRRLREENSTRSGSDEPDLPEETESARDRGNFGRRQDADSSGSSASSSSSGDGGDGGVIGGVEDAVDDTVSSAREITDDGTYRAQKAAETAAETVDEGIATTTETAGDVGRDVRQAVDQRLDRTATTTRELRRGARRAVDERIDRTADTASDIGQDVRRTVDEGINRAADTAQDVGRDVGAAADEGFDRAVETAEDVGSDVVEAGTDFQRRRAREGEQFGDVDWSVGTGGSEDEVEQSAEAFQETLTEGSKDVGDTLFSRDVIGESLGHATLTAAGYDRLGDQYDRGIRNLGSGIAQAPAATVGAIPKLGLETAELGIQTATNPRETASKFPEAVAAAGVGTARSVRQAPGRTAGNLIGGAALGAGIGKTALGSGKTGAALRYTDPDVTRVARAGGRVANRLRRSEGDATPDAIRRTGEQPDLGSGGTGSVLDAETVDQARGVSGPSRVDLFRGRVRRQASRSREQLGERLPDVPDMDERGQADLTGIDRRRSDSGSDTEQPTEFTDASQTDVGDTRSGRSEPGQRPELETPSDRPPGGQGGGTFSDVRQDALTQIQDQLRDVAQRERDVPGRERRDPDLDPIGGDGTQGPTIDRRPDQDRFDEFGSTRGPERTETVDTDSDLPSESRLPTIAGAGTGSALGLVEQAQQSDLTWEDTDTKPFRSTLFGPMTRSEPAEQQETDPFSGTLFGPRSGVYPPSRTDIDTGTDSETGLTTTPDPDPTPNPDPVLDPDPDPDVRPDPAPDPDPDPDPGWRYTPDPTPDPDPELRAPARQWPDRDEDDDKAEYIPYSVPFANPIASGAQVLFGGIGFGSPAPTDTGAGGDDRGGRQTPDLDRGPPGESPLAAREQRERRDGRSLPFDEFGGY